MTPHDIKRMIWGFCAFFVSLTAGGLIVLYITRNAGMWANLTGTALAMIGGFLSAGPPHSKQP